MVSLVGIGNFRGGWYKLGDCSFFYQCFSLFFFSWPVTAYLFNKEYIPVLTYHHVQEEGTFDIDKQGRLIVTPQQLEKQLLYLKLAGYKTITCQELESYYKGKAKLPSKPLLLTFDDGYNSTYELAFPILEKLNIKATVFVPVALIRDEENNRGHPSFFTWQQAREMVDSGLIDIQSHTYDLHKTIKIRNEEKNALTNKMIIGGIRETDKEYNKRIEEDLTKSKKVIEDYLGTKVVAISFPFGDFNKGVIVTAYSSPMQK